MCANKKKRKKYEYRLQKKKSFSYYLLSASICQKKLPNKRVSDDMIKSKLQTAIDIQIQVTKCYCNWC